MPRSSSVAPLAPVPLAATVILAAVLHAGCINHHLALPVAEPSGVTSWHEHERAGELAMRLQWARPEGDGRHPAVLVHPLAGKSARDLRGVVWDLARRGYVAVACDYRRVVDGEPRKTMFAWRSEPDSAAALAMLRDHPAVDRDRIALLGFSQGGVFSLLIASRSHDVKAVVAYYPVTDFERWLDERHANPVRRLVFRLIRRHFFRQSGARDEAEFSAFMGRASAHRHADGIRAPVLLVHGTKDRTASPRESVLMAGRLRELGGSVELLLVEDASHAFNFKDEEQARMAWEATIAFLDEHVGEGRDSRPHPLDTSRP